MNHKIILLLSNNYGKLFFLFLLCILPLQLSAQDKNSRRGDEAALRSLYNKTDGDNWYDNTGWNHGDVSLDDKPVGITVRKINGEKRVTRIDMQKVHMDGVQTLGNNMTGSIDKVLWANLKKVRYLNLKQNDLTGPIPSSLGYMYNLEWLSLAGQRCDVVIGTNNEPVYSGCSKGNVTKVDQVTNKFLGDIPSSLGNLTNLKVLELRRQYLTGTLPPELGNCTKMEGIYIDYIETPDGKYSEDALSGPIPASWGKMSKLRDIQLSQPRYSIRGQINLDGYTGEVPIEFQRGLTSDKKSYVSIGYNSLTGEVPLFSNLNDIRRLNLGANNFTGSFPIQYFQGSNGGMWFFSIEDNNLTGSIPTNFSPPRYPSNQSNYNNISVFWIRGNNFTGPFPDWLQNISSHVQLIINSNAFTGAFPGNLAEDPKLRLFSISDNNFSGSLPDINWNSKALYSIVINDNNLTGTFPDSWKSLVTNKNRIWRIDAQDNNLSGVLPKWLGDVPTLERIKLQNNRFTFKDILPHYDYILNGLQQAVNRSASRLSSPMFEIAPQKPFGQSRQRTVATGESLVLDLSQFDYAGNQYQWFLGENPISGANDPVLTIPNVGTEDAGTYHLEVSNPALPELGTQSSQPITVQVGGDNHSVGSTDATTTISYHKGWNLVSTPLNEAKRPFKELFKGIIPSSIYSFDGTYALSNNLFPGKGYWIKLRTYQKVVYKGPPLKSLDLSLKQGWNLIGSLVTTVNIRTEIQDPDNIIIKICRPSSKKSSDLNCESVNSLKPGKAYFIKVRHAGSISLN